MVQKGVQNLYNVNKVTEPIIVHHCYQKADLLYVFWRDIKDDGLIIDWIQSVSLCRCLPLLQSTTLTHQWDLHIWICTNERNREGKRSFIFRIPVWLCSYTQYLIWITRCTGDVHGLEIASLNHGDGQSARCRQVAEWKHQIPEIHVIL